MAHSAGQPSQSTTDRAASTTEMHFLPVLEAGSLSSRCWQKPLSLACRWSSSPPCPHMVVPLGPNLLFLEGHQSHQIRAHPNDIFLTLISYLFQGPISKYSYIPQDWGRGLKHMNLRDTIWPITEGMTLNLKEHRSPRTSSFGQRAVL